MISAEAERGTPEPPNIRRSQFRKFAATSIVVQVKRKNISIFYYIVVVL